MKTTRSAFASLPAVDPNGPVLQVYVVGDQIPDKQEFDRVLDENHYLGSKCQGGDYLRQIVFKAGEPVALLSWGSACYALADRDVHIDWDATRRAALQKLVVQNRRFCLLTPKGSEPNLASQALGAAFRKLPSQWLARFGYEPLAAETFSDIEAFAGTCYKATGWVPLGLTKGYSRHRADYFVPNHSPKKLWFKTFRPDALDLLKGGGLPPECQAGAHSDDQGVLPLSDRQVESLMDTLHKYRDPRDRNRTYPLFAVLAVIGMALMTGARDISSIARFAKRMSQSQRKKLTLPCKKGTSFRKAASYDVIRRVLKVVDPEQLAALISEWLGSQKRLPPGILAVDGKMIGDVAGIVSLVDTRTGAAVATAPMRHKKEGERGEAIVSRKLVGKRGTVGGKIVTGDALHCNQAMGRAVLDQGGDYVFGAKDNQPEVRRVAEAVLGDAPLFGPNPRNGTDV